MLCHEKLWVSCFMFLRCGTYVPFSMSWVYVLHCFPIAFWLCLLPCSGEEDVDLKASQYLCWTWKNSKTFTINTKSPSQMRRTYKRLIFFVMINTIYGLLRIPNPKGSWDTELYLFSCVEGQESNWLDRRIGETNKNNEKLQISNSKSIFSSFFSVWPCNSLLVSIYHLVLKHSRQFRRWLKD